MTEPYEITTWCAVHLGEEDTERLVGWIAWRVGRSQALAGAGTPLERLEHAVTHWLDESRRGAYSPGFGGEWPPVSRLTPASPTRPARA